MGCSFRGKLAPAWPLHGPQFLQKISICSADTCFSTALFRKTHAQTWFSTGCRGIPTLALVHLLPLLLWPSCSYCWFWLVFLFICIFVLPLNMFLQRFQQLYWCAQLCPVEDSWRSRWNRLHPERGKPWPPPTQGDPCSHTTHHRILLVSILCKVKIIIIKVHILFIKIELRYLEK